MSRRKKLGREPEKAEWTEDMNGAFSTIEGLEPHQVRMILEKIRKDLFKSKGWENYNQIRRGNWVEVYWPSDGAFYWGRVITKNSHILDGVGDHEDGDYGMIYIEFEDGDEMWIHPVDVRTILEDKP